MDDELLDAELEEPEAPLVRDFQLRSKPHVTTPPEEIARIFGRRDTLEDKRKALEAIARPLNITQPAQEVSADKFIKRTKTGAWSTQSTWGKIVTQLDALGIPYKVGESHYFSGDDVKAIMGKVEGKQTKRVTDYVLIPGSEQTHVWLNFPWRGALAAVRGSEVSWRGRLYSSKEWMEEMVRG
jgi:hypothetical protein